MSYLIYSEDDSGHGGSVGPSGTGSHTTLDILRGLGFNNPRDGSTSGQFSPIRTQHDPFEEDNPEVRSSQLLLGWRWALGKLERGKV